MGIGKQTPKNLVTAIRIISKNKPIVLLDYNTNHDVWNPKSPLSHASLIKGSYRRELPRIKITAGNMDHTHSDLTKAISSRDNH